MYKLLIKNKHYMRRIVSLFICCISAFVMYAQTEHMKFMGIPLNGTISSFQSKLLSKGIKYDEVLSRHLGVGCRCFNGNFSGEKANIYVYYKIDIFFLHIVVLVFVQNIYLYQYSHQFVNYLIHTF